MKKRILSMALALCMVLTLLPGSVFAAAEQQDPVYIDPPSIGELEQAFWTMGAAAQLGGGYFDAETPVPDTSVWWYLEISGLLNDYLDWDSGFVVIPYAKYIALVDSLFANHSDMVDYLTERTYYDAETQEEIPCYNPETGIVKYYAGGAGDEWTWIPTYIQNDGYDYHVQGVFLYEQYQESEIAGLRPYFDYYPEAGTDWETGAPTTWYWKISTPQELSVIRTDSGYKMSAFQPLDYYIVRGESSTIAPDYELYTFADGKVTKQYSSLEMNAYNGICLNDGTIAFVDETGAPLADSMTTFAHSSRLWYDTETGFTFDAQVKDGYENLTMQCSTSKNSSMVELPYTVAPNSGGVLLGANVDPIYTIQDDVVLFADPAQVSAYRLHFELDENVTFQGTIGGGEATKETFTVPNDETKTYDYYFWPDSTSDLFFEIADGFCVNDFELIPADAGTIFSRPGMPIIGLRLTAPATLRLKASTEVVREDESGVKITAPVNNAGDFYGFDLSVQDVTGTAAEADRGLIVAELGEKISTKIYDLSMVTDLGYEFRTDAEMTVSIPVPAGWNAEKTAVYYVDSENQTITNLKAVLSEDGKFLVFQTTHFSHYALVQDAAHVHAYTESIVAPTCTEQGYTLHTCDCGDSYKDNYTEPAGHKMGEWKIKGEPTCTTGGQKMRTCTVCNDYAECVFVDALGHDYHNGKCTRCGEADPDYTPVYENPFTDLKQKEYYYTPVLWAVNHDPQITNGMSATRFEPDRTCTRAQVVTFLWRAMGCPEPETSVCPFRDVPSSQYYYKAVLWAAENGVTTGATATTFAPNATVTRAQFVTFLWRAVDKPAAGGSNPFRDVSANQYYYNAVLWAAQNGVTTGVTATTFVPNAPCTRGQVVTFLYRQLA